jgi:hypothetical protein
MLINPVMVIASAAVGVGVCRAASVNPHVPEMLVACGICLLAAAMGMIPIARQPKEASAAALFQSAFLGSVLHLAGAVAFAALVLFWRKPGTPFIYWLLVMYWLTLIGLCAVFVKRLRTPAKPVGTVSN